MAGYVIEDRQFTTTLPDIAGPLLIVKHVGALTAELELSVRPLDEAITLAQVERPDGEIATLLVLDFDATAVTAGTRGANATDSMEAA